MVYPYMIGSGKWDAAHSRARSFSMKKFSAGDPKTMARKSGATYNSEQSLFVVKSFGQELSVTFPGGDVYFLGTDTPPLIDLCLEVINYLARADGYPLSGSLISYRELVDGYVYYPAFHRESISLLSSSLPGKNPELFAQAARQLGGSIIEGADMACVINPLPLFPVTIKLWFPDDEMEGSSNILFDSSANHYLHTEDIAAIGDMLSGFH